MGLLLLFSTIEHKSIVLHLLELIKFDYDNMSRELLVPGETSPDDLAVNRGLNLLFTAQD